MGSLYSNCRWPIRVVKIYFDSEETMFQLNLNEELYELDIKLMYCGQHLSVCCLFCCTIS